jgi:uncharacterized protein YlxW (UPF0749 family)
MIERSYTRDVTTPLLTRITNESLDQDYRLAALRHDGDSKVRPRLGRSAMIVVAGFGLLVGTAAARAAQSADDNQGERSSLVDQIANGRDRVSDQRKALTRLRADARDLESEIATIDQGLSSAESTIGRLDGSTGFSQVRGPGLRIVVDEAPDADDLGLVRADDLGILLDGLWNAGAEAIAIDDQRITSLTALRNSGLSIGVNRIPLRAPYTIRVIGNPSTLQADLLDSTSGLAWQALVDQFGFRIEIDNVEEMTLPAGELRPLQAARLSSASDDPGEVQERRP